MDYITELQKLNISFNRYDEKTAAYLMKTEYSYYKLIEYTAVFDKYSGTDKIGQFLNLDFSQLYYLAQIDETLSHIIIRQCLEIEQTLKTFLAYGINKYGDYRLILDSFIEYDHDYLKNTYSCENLDIMSNKYANLCFEQLTLPQFLDVIQFGTLERFLFFVSLRFPDALDFLCNSAFFNHISSVRQLRNMVAHNISLISKLPEKSVNNTHDVSTYLSRGGIKSKTLHTNMSKVMVNDYCSLLHLYYSIEPMNRIINNYCNLRWFLYSYCENYFEAFSSNWMLKSTHNFLCSVIEMYTGEKKKSP